MECGVCARLCDFRGEAAPRPRTGEARAERALDVGGGVHGFAQPPPPRDAVSRSFAHANYLGPNLRE